MKYMNNFNRIIIIFSFVLISCAAYSQQINSPSYDSKDIPEMDIVKIDRQRTKTVVYLKYTAKKKDIADGIFEGLDEEIYLRDCNTNRKYFLTDVIDAPIYPQSASLRDYNGILNFALVFPALPNQTEVVDLIEPIDGLACNFWEVEIQGGNQHNTNGNNRRSQSERTNIYESERDNSQSQKVSLNDKKVEYRNGQAWPYYEKNGIVIAMTNNTVKSYGKYFQISIVIMNGSNSSIEFNPDLITAGLFDKKGQGRRIRVLSSNEYMRKVKRKQNWDMAMVGLSEGLAAAGAGYSSSTTTSSTNYSGNINSSGRAYASGSGGYAYGSYRGSTNYSGNSSTTSRTTSYNGAEAYRAQVIASERMNNYNNSLLQDRYMREEGYLKRTTIYPGETIVGYINIERKRGVSMSILVDIGGIKYEFPWNVQ